MILQRLIKTFWFELKEFSVQEDRSTLISLRGINDAIFVPVEEGDMSLQEIIFFWHEFHFYENNPIKRLKIDFMMMVEMHNLLITNMKLRM